MSHLESKDYRTSRIAALRETRRLFIQVLGYPLNLSHPETYCEKIQWLKFYHNHDDEKIIQRADKFEVRNFIKEKDLAEHLVPLYGCYDDPREIDWGRLPSSFVIKFNNASGPRFHWIITDKSRSQHSSILGEIMNRMGHRFGLDRGETHYSRMAQKIIVEEYLQEPEGHELKEYKLYCFHGRVAFISAECGRFGNLHVRDYYTKGWEKAPIDFYRDLPRPSQPFERPQQLERMIAIAEALSEGYPHVRVDLYNLGRKVYFGELTYTPESGITQWNPRLLDLWFGRLMDIYCITH